MNCLYFSFFLFARQVLSLQPHFFDRKEMWRKETLRPELRSLINCKIRPEQVNSLRSNSTCFVAGSLTLITHSVMDGLKGQSPPWGGGLRGWLIKHIYPRECAACCNSEHKRLCAAQLVFSAEHSEDVVNNCVLLLSFRHFLSSCLANKKKENDKQITNFFNPLEGMG